MSSFLIIVTDRSREPWIIPSFENPKGKDFRQLFYLADTRTFYTRVV